MKLLTRKYLPVKPLFILISLVLFFILPAAISFKVNEQVVQINLKPILKARSVTTLTEGKIITWTMGIDGDGSADGYLTMAASLFKGDKSPKALPDNPLIPANDQHPEIMLHYSNKDSISNQTVAIVGAGTVGFDIPLAKYTQMFLALTSSEGNSQITVILQYSDVSESKSFDVPDYYADIQPNDPNFCYLAHDLAKWGKTNNMTESNHHNIDLLNIHPDPKRSLKHIQLEKSKAGYLVLWSATGIAIL